MLSETVSFLFHLHLRLLQRHPRLVQLLREVSMLHPAPPNQRPAGGRRPSLLSTPEAGPDALHHQELEELCQPLGDELRRANAAGAAETWLHVPQPHAGVPVPLQPETRHGAHQTLPDLPAHRCTEAAPAVGGERLAFTLEEFTLA